MELGKHVVDRGIADASERLVGKVDDVLVEWPDDLSDAPVVAAIITGPLALSRNLPRWCAWLARLAYRLCGVDDPRPIAIAWSHVTRIDVTVHLDLDREEAQLDPFERAIGKRFIRRLPGA